MKTKKIEYFDLWLKLQNSKSKHQREKIKRQLASIYFPLVTKISFNLSRHLEWKVNPDELASFGVDGLYSAIERFSLSRGISFPSYASIRIRGSMIDGIRREDLIPRSVRSNHNKLERATNRLRAEKGVNVAAEDIAEEAGMNHSDMLKNSQKYTPVSFVSIDGSSICDSSKQDDFKQDAADIINDKRSVAPDAKILRREFFFKLISKGFSRIEQKIIYLYYYQDLTMDAIAEKLGISESRISQIHKDIIPRLKDKISRNPRYFNHGTLEEVLENDDKESLFTV